MTVPAPARMRKPRLCDACRVAVWPAHGIGAPGLMSEAPPALRSVYLWHCGAPACEADCRSRFAAQLRTHGRADLAARLLGETRLAAPRPDVPADLPPPSPGAARAAARKSTQSRPADPGNQGALFGV